MSAPCPLCPKPDSAARFMSTRPGLRGSCLMRAADHELDGFGKRVLHRRVGEQRQRVLGHGAVVARALDRVLERAMLAHQRDRGGEIALGGVALLERTAPEVALALRPAAE